MYILSYALIVFQKEVLLFSYVGPSHNLFSRKGRYGPLNATQYYNQRTGGVLTFTSYCVALRSAPRQSTEPHILGAAQRGLPRRGRPPTAPPHALPPLQPGYSGRAAQYAVVADPIAAGSIELRRPRGSIHCRDAEPSPPHATPRAVQSTAHIRHWPATFRATARTPAIADGLQQ